MLWATAGAACATFLITAALLPGLIPLARRSGLLDRPGGRRKHDKPVPAIGGLAIFLGLAVTTGWFQPPTLQTLGIAAAVVVIVVAGVADDLFRLRWPYRLSAQVLAALLMIYLGGVRIENLGAVFGMSASLGALSVPLTVVATVGIINAVNMADGVDGLAGLLVLATTAMLWAAAIYSGNGGLAVALGLIAGAICGFLVYNMRTPWNPRAQVFLGNAGSELLGLLVACASFRLTQNPDHPVGVHVAPFLLAPVLIDCLTLMIRRVRAGVSPFQGDRNHLHHMMLDAGFSPSRVALVIAGVSLAIGSIAGLAVKAHVPAPAFTLAFAALCLAHFLATSDRDRFVRQIAGMGLFTGLVPAPRQLEAWQIAARAAGAHYRRAEDHPLLLDEPAPAEAEQGGLVAAPPAPVQAETSALFESNSSK